MSDHYRTLQVTRDAEPLVIERAYKALCLSHHPDTAPPGSHAGATRKMQEINEAYRVLRDPALRQRYDASLPVHGESGWEQFWERGLIGLFVDHFGRS